MQESGSYYQLKPDPEKLEIFDIYLDKNQFRKSDWAFYENISQEDFEEMQDLPPFTKDFFYVKVGVYEALKRRLMVYSNMSLEKQVDDIIFLIQFTKYSAYEHRNIPTKYIETFRNENSILKALVGRESGKSTDTLSDTHFKNRLKWNQEKQGTLNFIKNYRNKKADNLGNYLLVTDNKSKLSLKLDSETKLDLDNDYIIDRILEGLETLLEKDEHLAKDKSLFNGYLNNSNFYQVENYSDQGAKLSQHFKTKYFLENIITYLKWSSNDFNRMGKLERNLFASIVGLVFGESHLYWDLLNDEDEKWRYDQQNDEAYRKKYEKAFAAKIDNMAWDE